MGGRYQDKVLFVYHEVLCLCQISLEPRRFLLKSNSYINNIGIKPIYVTILELASSLGRYKHQSVFPIAIDISTNNKLKMKTISVILAVEMKQKRKRPMPNPVFHNLFPCLVLGMRV